MDEEIVLAVADSMRSMGRLDPNWAVPEMPVYFRQPQYNFYTYNVVSFGWIELARAIHVPPIVVLRAMNVVYQAAAIVFSVFALRRLRLPAASQWLAAIFLTVAPALVHDAHIGRCESFLYMIFGAVIYAAAAERLWIGGLLIGVGAASKITFLATGAVLLGAVDWRSARSIFRDVAIIGAAICAGFAISAPYTLVNFGPFLRGMEALHHAYYNAFPPHTLIDGTPWRNASRVVAFAIIVYGGLLPLVLISIRRLRPVLIGVWIASVATFAYFLPVPMFMERNLAVAMFGFLVVFAACVAQLPARIATIAVVALGPMIYWSLQIAFVIYEGQGARRSHWETAHLQQQQQVTWFFSSDPDFSSKVPTCSGLMAIPDLNDDYSARIRRYLEATGHTLFARYHSRFSLLPTNTLHTTFDTDITYYRC